MLRFPLGAMPKPQVRALADEFGLAVADKADSQDICFVPAGHYSEMIERLLPGAAEAGDIVHVDGRVLGRHAGVLHYTIGQRRGLGVAAAEPLYVVALDAQQRPRRRRPASGARDPPHPPARRQLDRRRRVRRYSRRRPGDRGARALDPAADAGPSAAGRRGRIRRAGERRLARPGLRVLRVVRRQRAGARRRVYRRGGGRAVGRPQSDAHFRHRDGSQRNPLASATSLSARPPPSQTDVTILAAGLSARTPPTPSP